MALPVGHAGGAGVGLQHHGPLPATEPEGQGRHGIGVVDVYDVVFAFVPAQVSTVPLGGLVSLKRVLFSLESISSSER